jgi:hypothetical protein
MEQFSSRMRTFASRVRDAVNRSLTGRVWDGMFALDAAYLADYRSGTFRLCVG